MLKSILLFIKSHILITSITTIAVAGIIISTSIVINNYMLDKNVKENLGMLVSSDFQSNINNKTLPNDSKTNENNIPINTDEPLTFRIEEVFLKKDGGGIVKDTQGNDAYEMSSEGVEYKIVPSYDKDYSKWTKEEKEAYQKAYEDAAKMVKEYYDNLVENESKAMLDAMIATQEITNSFSKEYTFPYRNLENGISFESWNYNSYLKLYNCGTATQNYGDDIYKTVQISQAEFSGVTKDVFRNIVYPSLEQKIEDYIQQQIADDPYGVQANPEIMQEIQDKKQELLNDLNELNHLSD